MGEREREKEINRLREKERGENRKQHGWRKVTVGKGT
jgi:hypothetical protein